MIITQPSPPPLPCLKELPYDIAIDGLTGYLCGRLCQVNPYLTATIFAIRCLTNNLFFQLANSGYTNINLESQKRFLITSLLVNTTFLVTLKELRLIGHFLSCIIGGATVGYIINRAVYIQTQERQLIIDEMNQNESH